MLCDEDQGRPAKWRCQSCNAVLCDECDARIHTLARVLAVAPSNRCSPIQLHHRTPLETTQSPADEFDYSEIERVCELADSGELPDPARGLVPAPAMVVTDGPQGPSHGGFAVRVPMERSGTPDDDAFFAQVEVARLCDQPPNTTRVGTGTGTGAGVGAGAEAAEEEDEEDEEDAGAGEGPPQTQSIHSQAVPVSVDDRCSL
jgi:hypothetical protein